MCRYSPRTRSFYHVILQKLGRGVDLLHRPCGGYTETDTYVIITIISEITRSPRCARRACLEKDAPCLCDQCQRGPGDLRQLRKAPVTPLSLPAGPSPAGTGKAACTTGHRPCSRCSPLLAKKIRPDRTGRIFFCAPGWSMVTPDGVGPGLAGPQSHQRSIRRVCFHCPGVRRSSR